MEIFLKIEELMTGEDSENVCNAVKILYKIVNGVCCFPKNPDYSRLSLESSDVKTLLQVDGGMECLFEIGFDECDGHDVLDLRDTADVEKIGKIRTILRNLKQKTERVIYQPQSNQFLQSLVNQHRQVAWLSDEGSSNLALRDIPLEILQRYLRKEERKFKNDNVNGSFCGDYAKLRFLVSWFKDEFFEWVDKPECPKCRTTFAVKFTQMTMCEDYRIENFLCKKCNVHVQFPRYNDPEKLLVTRKGRCGEWAICFTYICRALSLDARIVYDVTDHVWTEVYIHSEEKWLHCDPCEGLIDKPLIYESGWKKKLSYIFAYSLDEIQDVTWRYSSHHRQILERRRNISEQKLCQFLTTYREACLAVQPKPRRDIVIRRCLLELASMLVEHQPLEDDMLGRKSGSLEWRVNRGETNLKKYTWKIEKKDVVDNEWTLQYSTVKDSYYINNIRVDRKWNAGIHSHKNIFRKVEKDWKKVYLARTDGSLFGKISWSFQTDPGFMINVIKTDIQVSIFPSGTIDVTLHSNGISKKVVAGNCFETKKFKGCQSLILEARLSGGDGPVSWQHAQLFRQNLDDDYFPFQVTITLLPSEQT